MSARRSATNSCRISACNQCGAALPLCHSENPQESRNWQCTACGRSYYACLDSTFTLDELRQVRPEPILFVRAVIPPPSEELLRAAERLRLVPDHDGRDKRRSPRYPVAMNVPAQQLDARLNPVDCQFMVVARNISTGGICLLYDRAIQTPFLALELANARSELFQVLVHVRRSRLRGKVHEIGGAFVTKMATESAWSIP